MSLQHSALDAIPDLSDTQVIVYTEYQRSGAAGDRGSGHLSADDGDADRAEIESGARLFVLRRFVRLHHFRGWHRHLLGALARPRISERGGAQAAGRRDAHLGTGRDRRRLGLSICAAVQGQIAGRPALTAGLDHPLRHLQGRRRRRGRQRRRLRQAIQRRRRSEPAAGAGHPACESARCDPRQQHGCRRPHGGAVGIRIHRARPWLRQKPCRSCRTSC